jgi:hypothetical protein
MTESAYEQISFLSKIKMQTLLISVPVRTGVGTCTGFCTGISPVEIKDWFCKGFLIKTSFSMFF